MNPFFKDLTPDIAATTFEELLKQYENRRIEAGNEYENLYNACTKPVKPKTMSYDRYTEVQESWVPVPLLKVIVSTISSMMYGRAIERTTGSDEYDAMLEPLWTFMKILMPSICTSASKQGDGAIRIVPDWENGITLTWWDGRHIVPIYNPGTMKVVGMIYDVLADPISSQISRGLGGHGDVKDIKELVTKHIRHPETGEIIQPGVRARFVDGERVPWENDLEEPELDGYNPLGDYLDCVFWLNDMDAGKVRGVSDAEAIAPMLNSVNEMLVQGRMVIKYNAYPVITTTAKFKTQPSVHAGKVFQLGVDQNGNPATMNYLEWSQEMKGYMDFLDRIISLIHESASVPEVAIGDLEHIGSLSSGRAYEVAMSPLLKLIGRRQEIYTQQELALMELLLAGLAHVGRIPALTSPEFGIQNMPDMQKIKPVMEDASVEFSPVRVARDELTDAQVHSMRISSGYESEETAIRLTHPEWPDEKVLEELKKSGADEVQKVDAEVDLRSRQAIDIIDEEE